MLKNTIQQLEKLETNALDENVRICGGLEAEVSKRRLSQWNAWAVRLLLFTIALLLATAFIWVEALVENGQGPSLPSVFQRMFAQGIAAKELTAYYRTFLTLVCVLLFLPVVTDVVFSALGRASQAGAIAPKAANALKSSGVEKKLKYLEEGLVRSEGRLGFKLLTFDDTKGALLLHGLCIGCSLLCLCICRMDGDGLLRCILAAVLWFFLCELAFLVSSLPMILLFSDEQDLRRIRNVRSKLPEYSAQVRLDAMPRWNGGSTNLIRLNREGSGRSGSAARRKKSGKKRRISSVGWPASAVSAGSAAPAPPAATTPREAISPAASISPIRANAARRCLKTP